MLPDRPFHMVENQEIAGARGTRRVHQYIQDIRLFQHVDRGTDHATIEQMLRFM
jgi:hypothetical protein